MRCPLLISSPFGPESRSGNWRTASRYAELLAGAGLPVRLVVGLGRPQDWQGVGAALMLHARRSHAVARHAHALQIPSAVVLTGTDLYGDLGPTGGAEAAAQCSQTLAHAVVAITLQPEADQALRSLQARTPSWAALQLACIPQTTAWGDGSRSTPADPHRCLMVGHVRPEKDPETGFRGFLLAQGQIAGLQLTHIGASLDDALMARLQSLSALHGGAIEMLGGVDHPAVRSWMDRSGVLIHPSRAEGGAMVLAEAIARGLWVLASDIPGNRGVLGADYPGLFPPGDAQALAGQLIQLVCDAQHRRRLQAAGAALRPVLSAPQRERDALLNALRPLFSRLPPDAQAPAPPVQ